MSQVFEKIRYIIINDYFYNDEYFDIDEDVISLDTSLLLDLTLDSFDIIEFLMALEEEFGIEIPDEDAEKLFHPDVTVGDVVRYIEGKV